MSELLLILLLVGMYVLVYASACDILAVLKEIRDRLPPRDERKEPK